MPSVAETNRAVPHVRSFPRLLVAALAVLLPVRAFAGDYDRWYTVEMGAQCCGYMHASQKTADGKIISDSALVFEMGRGQASVAIKMEGSFTETADGKPISMHREEKLGTIPKITEYTFGETEMAITAVEGDQTTRSTRKLPEGAWLTPAAASDYIAQRLKAGAEKIVVRAIDPMSGPDVDTMTLTGFERTTVEAMGKTVPAIKCTSTSSNPAAKGMALTEFLDEQGIPIRSQVSMGLFTLNVTATDKATATAKNHEVPELMVKTFIKPDRPIAHPRDIRRTALVLSVPDGTMPELPTTGVQRAEVLSPQSVRLTIGGEPSAAPEADAKDAAFLASTSMLRTEDPEIKKLAERSTAKAGDDKAARAEAMRRFVEKYVKTKDLDVGFASASEVARTRHGDCTEHGVLLAAMLRADGIPARVVSGLVYVQLAEAPGGIFGYHMWAQALLDKGGKPTWVDLDGTLPGAHAFDATHIALGTSALAEGEEAQSLASILPLMGRLAIKVESAE